MYDIDTLLDEVVTLPSMPIALAGIVQTMNNPSASLADIARAISVDPAIALKTLRLVNSAYCGLRQKVNSIDHAVAMLGLKVVKNLVFTATVFESLHTKAAELVTHSIACGFAMRALTEDRTVAQAAGIASEEGFVYGLLHDIGKILLDQFLPKEVARIAELAKKAETPWFRAERQIIGVDHAQVGSRIARKWNLQAELAGAIAGHHELESATKPEFRGAAAALGVADYLCSAAGFPAMAGAVMEMPQAALDALSLSQAALEPATARFRLHEPAIEELVALAM